MKPAEAKARARALDLPERAHFDEVQAYCMFIGIGRSGHSLVGTLLGAHRDCIIAHELNALRHFEAGLQRDEVYSLILDNARSGARDSWAADNGYSHGVPNADQGSFDVLRVIGDKRGGATTRRLRAAPELIDVVRDAVGVPLRIVHVIRNPYDNIASWRNHYPEQNLEAPARDYFAASRTNADLREQLGDSVFDLRHEDLIAAPRERLAELCAFMGLEADPAYLDACASVVYADPHRSRSDFTWPRELKAEVEREIANCDFLAGYSFDS